MRHAPVLSGGAPRPLDTLAQLDQRAPLDRKQTLVRRARAKYMTLPLAIALAELKSPLEKSYRNAIYCAGDLEQDENGRIRGFYCGTRWCLVCNRVRLARAINRYHGPITNWCNPHFITLTLPNVGHLQLRGTIEAMLRDLVAIARGIRRTDRLPFRALRKLECTYNPRRDDFHPHFHFIVEGRASADALLGRWLALHSEANPDAQDIRPCNSKSLMELFKYFTKLVVSRPEKPGVRMIAPAHALDAIFRAIVGRRVFQPIGFTVAVAPSEDEAAEVGISGDTISASRLGERIRWEWIQSVHDWIDYRSGEALSGYDPTAAMTAFVHTPVGGEPPCPVAGRSMLAGGS